MLKTSFILICFSLYLSSKMSLACDADFTSSMVTRYEVGGPLFMNTLATFFAAQCALIGDDVWPADASIDDIQNTEFDFIVVGAGTAGAVVANRLTEATDWNVLLIEAGGNPTLGTEIPAMFFNNVQTEVDWNYRSQPDDLACLSYDAGCAFPRGKVLGGSSSINGLYHVRGNKLDYDEWAALGNDGWSYEDVLPYFNKIETYGGSISDANKLYHNDNGYLHVEVANVSSNYEDLFLAAEAELNVTTLADINEANQMGATLAFTTSKNGIRQSSARAYLSPIKDRTNLYVMKNAIVSQVLFDDDLTATGVVVSKDEEDYTFYASKEIILSAGVFNTPQILMLSGIGPQEHLDSFDIEVLADLPVGKNFQDHLMVKVMFAAAANATPSDTNIFTGVATSISQVVEFGNGSFSSTSPFRVISFINTTDSSATSPDIQHLHILHTVKSYDVIDFYTSHGYNSDYVAKFNELNENNVIAAPGAVLLRPKSRGQILLQSTDPLDSPLIIANFFNETDDLDTIVRGMQHTLELGETDSFKNAGFQLTWLEVDACSSYDKSSIEFLQCMARQTVSTLYHGAGTAKMGLSTDETAVVGPDLKVHGVNSLRVIDASIMPYVTRGNTNTPTFMIAEKGADMIKSSWNVTDYGDYSYDDGDYNYDDGDEYY